MTEEESCDFDASISEEEREFYLRAYPTPEQVRDRKTHCTTCKVHIGTAPVNDQGLKMHPILRVTHCNKCHDFYNSGEFSKGEDGSELYCRWCGQGGEVYCCSNCPFVFCKSCITKNLSRGVVADIEQNENWRCFACAPKILWPLRALHWALVNYIEKQKKEIKAMNLSEAELKTELSKDRSTCCRLAKAKCGNMSDSMESVDSLTSKRSSSSGKKKASTPLSQTPPVKKTKTSNDEVVCTPDFLSMLEPDCQITLPTKQPVRTIQPVTTPKIFTVQQNYVQPTPQRNNLPRPVMLRNTGIQVRPVGSPPVIRRTVVSPRTPSPVGSNSPVYHTINGYRIDLNSAAQQGTYRLPNGKLIQVKRQSAPTATASGSTPSPSNNWPQPSQTSQRVALQPTTGTRPVQITPRPYVTMQSPPVVTGTPQSIRYPSGVIGNTVIAPFNHSTPQIQMINGSSAPGMVHSTPVRPAIIRQNFPDNQVGQARTKLQEQIFSAMEICQHLTGKLQTLTNSNAYKTARNLLEVKELYIHLSYLLTYAIGRYKGLQDKCLTDMRQLGFANDADSLENGQIAAGIDYVRYGQLEDVELFTSGVNSFHSQIYEYRKSLVANLDDSLKVPLSPLHPLNSLVNEYDDIGLEDTMDDTMNGKAWSRIETIDDDDDDDVQEVPYNEESTNHQYMDSYMEEDTQECEEGNEEDQYPAANVQRSTEDVMRREEESHKYDRKLTRLIEQYPSIWCTRHPDYGNFEVTRKQWRTIASHFKRSGDIKMRWKNIRKRYVRIERRMREGKRFNGYFDKATNFLINRDRPMSEWVAVDCGKDDGDLFERTKLDAIEKNLHKGQSSHKPIKDDLNESASKADWCAPIEIRPLHWRIIHFVKCNPVLWRKSSDPAFHKTDEQTRKSLWMHLWKSVPDMRCSDLIEQWKQLYEMYKTFRLKTIKCPATLAALEVKYSKYLAKLYFLYKIDEEELLSENSEIRNGFDLKDDEMETDEDTKILDMTDDKEFVHQLVVTIRDYPQIWNPNHADYHDLDMRDETWNEIARRLESFGHKQASDDEDNEIEIVEPKTDTIDLDSDDDDQTTTQSSAKTFTKSQKSTTTTSTISKTTTSIKIPQPMQENARAADADKLSTPDEMTDFMDAAHNILASMLEIDIVEGNDILVPGGGGELKKPPRKKPNKPNANPSKKKKSSHEEKVREMKRNDVKLRSKCSVLLRRAEDEFPYTVGILKQRYEKGKEFEKRLAAAEMEIEEKEEECMEKNNSDKIENNDKNMDRNDKTELPAELISNNEINPPMEAETNTTAEEINEVNKKTIEDDEMGETIKTTENNMTEEMDTDTDNADKIITEKISTAEDYINDDANNQVVKTTDIGEEPIASNPSALSAEQENNITEESSESKKKNPDEPCVCVEEQMDKEDVGQSSDKNVSSEEKEEEQMDKEDVGQSSDKNVSSEEKEEEQMDKEDVGQSSDKNVSSEEKEEEEMDKEDVGQSSDKNVSSEEKEEEQMDKEDVGQSSDKNVSSEEKEEEQMDKEDVGQSSDKNVSSEEKEEEEMDKEDVEQSSDKNVSSEEKEEEKMDKEDVGQSSDKNVSSEEKEEEEMDKEDVGQSSDKNVGSEEKEEEEMDKDDVGQSSDKNVGSEEKEQESKSSSISKEQNFSFVIQNVEHINDEISMEDKNESNELEKQTEHVDKETESSSCEEQTKTNVLAVDDENQTEPPDSSLKISEKTADSPEMASNECAKASNVPENYGDLEERTVRASEIENMDTETIEGESKESNDLQISSSTSAEANTEENKNSETLPSAVLEQSCENKKEYEVEIQSEDIKITTTTEMTGIDSENVELLNINSENAEPFAHENDDTNNKKNDSIEHMEVDEMNMDAISDGCPNNDGEVTLDQTNQTSQSKMDTSEAVSVFTESNN